MEILKQRACETFPALSPLDSLHFDDFVVWVRSIEEFEVLAAARAADELRSAKDDA